jgi:uncharacterized protein YkwD
MSISKNILVAFATFFSLFVLASAASAANLSRSETTLLAAVNQTRAAYGLQPVRYDATLERAARAHSADMLRNRYFAHGAFARRMQAFGARGPFVGENLAWGAGSYADPSTVVREWLASPAHRANLLRPGFERIGISVLRGSFNGYGGAVVITADFGGR